MKKAYMIKDAKMVIDGVVIDAPVCNDKRCGYISYYTRLRKEMLHNQGKSLDGVIISDKFSWVGHYTPEQATRFDTAKKNYFKK
jgi:hypothetical protein